MTSTSHHVSNRNKRNSETLGAPDRNDSCVIFVEDVRHVTSGYHVVSSKHKTLHTQNARTYAHPHLCTHLSTHSGTYAEKYIYIHA